MFYREFEENQNKNFNVNYLSKKSNVNFEGSNRNDLRIKR